MRGRLGERGAPSVRRVSAPVRRVAPPSREKEPAGRGVRAPCGRACVPTPLVVVVLCVVRVSGRRVREKLVDRRAGCAPLEGCVFCCYILYRLSVMFVNFLRNFYD